MGRPRLRRWTMKGSIVGECEMGHGTTGSHRLEQRCRPANGDALS